MTQDAPSSLVTVRITRRFSASPERVFDAWLDPAKVQRWMAAPPGSGTVRVAVDPRVGGKFSFVARRQGEEVEHTGEYLEFDRPRRLVFTWVVPRFSTQVTIVRLDLVPLGSGTELTLVHERVLPDYEERTAGGWNAICDVIAASLEA